MLNAGATPRMGRLDQLSWADFNATWEIAAIERRGREWIELCVARGWRQGWTVVQAAFSLKDRDPPTRGTRATGEQIKSCTTIITGPNDFVAEVHDRMPVLLTEDQFAPWLSAHH